MPNFWIVGLQMVAMLSIVLAALFAVVFLSKRLSGKIKGQSGITIDVLCARQMGPKKQVVLLEVLGQRILVGVGVDTITRLASFPGEGKAFAGVLDEQMGIGEHSKAPKNTGEEMQDNSLSTGGKGSP